MTDKLAKLLNDTITDNKVIGDLWGVLNKCELEVEINDNLLVSIPKEATIDIVTKSYLLELFETVGFGVYKVLLAIGGFNEKSNGLHSAGICFSTLFYDKDCNLITIDFHEEFR